MPNNNKLSEQLLEHYATTQVRDSLAGPHTVREMSDSHLNRVVANPHLGVGVYCGLPNDVWQEVFEYEQSRRRSLYRAQHLAQKECNKLYRLASKLLDCLNSTCPGAWTVHNDTLDCCAVSNGTYTLSLSFLSGKRAGAVQVLVSTLVNGKETVTRKSVYSYFEHEELVSKLADKIYRLVVLKDGLHKTNAALVVAPVPTESSVSIPSKAFRARAVEKADKTSSEGTVQSTLTEEQAARVLELLCPGMPF